MDKVLKGKGFYEQKQYRWEKRRVIPAVYGGKMRGLTKLSNFLR